MNRSNSVMNVVILHSGGIDSTALIHFYSSLGCIPSSLFIDFGQPARLLERKAVEKICAHYNIPFKVIKVECDTEFADGNIQGRNFFLISAALMFSKIEMGIISIGIHSGTNYVDCGEPFVKSCANIFNQYSNGKIILGTPFLKWSKSEIFQYCCDDLIPIDLTYSCEKGLSPHCGECGTCKELKLIYDRKNK